MILAVPILEDLRKLANEDPRTNKELARLCGIPEANLSRFRTAKAGLSVPSAERLAEVLGVPMQLGEPKRKNGK